MQYEKLNDIQLGKIVYGTPTRNDKKMIDKLVICLLLMRHLGKGHKIHEIHGNCHKVAWDIFS
jgi:hypothetical protein